MKMGRDRGMNFMRQLDIRRGDRFCPEKDIRALKEDFPSLKLVLVILKKGDKLYGEYH